jgi:adenine-specific DNA-methyltransferase
MVKQKETKTRYGTKTKLVLSDNELRDIKNHLEKGIPLPDEYRFLLFGDKREVELVWNGKSGEVSNIVLPFQTIEQVDEPRKESSGEERQVSLFDFSTDTSGRQIGGWVNKLIWGDNKLILSSLKNGPLRQEIEKQGGIKLIYIDPPFDVGADFSMKINIGDDEFTKQPNVLEELAYRDTWGKGADSFIAMMYERLMLMRDLLAPDGVIFVHCDYRVNSYVRLILDEVFKKENFINEIIWKRTNNPKGSQFKDYQLGIATDTIYSYSKGGMYRFNLENVKRKLTKEELEEKYNKVDEKGRYYPGPIVRSASMGPRPTLVYEYNGFIPKTYGWRLKKENLIALDKKGDLGWTSRGKPFRKLRIEDDQGDPIYNLWDDVTRVSSPIYPTEKPEKLIEKLITLCSNEGDLICDFFCGSGTTLAVAEKLGRKWIGSDLGKFSIHTTRKRMINVQRELKKEGKDFRAFEILNLGRYERQHYVGVNPNLRDEEQQKQLAQKEQEFVKLILHAYRAEAAQGFKTFSGKKLSRMVAIGPINLPVGRLFVEECIDEAVNNKLTKVDVLAFEFEMGLFPHIQEEAKQRGVDLALKQIPREVFDKRAVEKNQVVFTDVAYIEVTPHYDGDKVAIELADFSVFYNQNSVKEAEETLKNNSSKTVIESGNIIKVSKDKDGIVTREPLIKSWTDWIDYWAVDFDFENKKEIIKVEKQKKQTGKLDLEKEYEEKWTGDYIFENEWQSFRTKKNRELELKTPFKKISGKRKIAIKVVDIFGNDTMKIIEIREKKK